MARGKSFSPSHSKRRTRRNRYNKREEVKRTLIVVNHNGNRYTIAGVMLRERFIPTTVAIGEAKTLTQLVLLPKYVINNMLVRTDRTTRRVMNIDNRVFDQVEEILAMIAEAQLNNLDIRDILRAHGVEYQLIQLNNSEEDDL